MMRATRRDLLGLGGAALALAGCSDLIPGRGPAPNLYTLTPKSTFDPELPKVAWQLVVEEPVATRGLDTDLIALTPSAVEIKYFARSRWVDRAPRMIQSLLVQSFERTGKIVSVGRQAIGLRSDFNLVSELRQFQADYSGVGQPAVTGQDTDAPPSGRPVIRIVLNAKIVKQPKQTIVASRTFEVALPATGTDMPSIVQSFDEALGKVLKLAVEWTLPTANAQATPAQANPLL
jgi:cholesterol transport system auxiliary component